MKLTEVMRWRLVILILGMVIVVVTLTAADDQAVSPYVGTLSWFDAGRSTVLPAEVEFDDVHGKLGVLNSGGPTPTKGHPFFEPLGTNGRACVTCHQPAYAMSVSAASLRERWRSTNGKDPVFAAVRRLQLPEPSAGQGKLAFAAAQSRAVPHSSSVAAARTRSRVHDRSGARSHRMQHQLAFTG